LLSRISFDKVFRDRAHEIQQDDSGQQQGHADQKGAPFGVGICFYHE
jgi:hypothetical protein